MATKRSPTTIETVEELLSLATEIRQIAGALDDLRARADNFSKPVYDAGWKYPIGSMRGFAHDLEGWAAALETIAGTEETPTS